MAVPQLLAVVRTFYVEELSELLPSLVLYAPEGYDDFWFNLGHMFDSVKIGEKVDMKRFTQTTQDAIDKAVEAGHLEPVHQMYKKPAMEDLRHDWGVSE